MYDMYGVMVGSGMVWYGIVWYVCLYACYGMLWSMLCHVMLCDVV